MSQLSKVDLKAENQLEFPNNNTGQITPANLRKFNVDMIDSTVNQTVFDSYSASVASEINALESFSASFNTQSLVNQINQKLDTASFNAYTASVVGLQTGSLLITASATLNTIQFTKGDGSTFNVTVDTGSTTINTGSLLTTASFNNATRNITFTKADASTFNLGGFATTGSNSGSSQFVGGQYFNTFGNNVVEINSANDSGPAARGLVVSGNFSKITSTGTNAADFAMSAGANTFSIGLSQSEGFARITSNGVLIATLGNTQSTFNVPVYVSSSFTASLATGFTYVGDGTGKTIAVATSSFASTINTGSLVTTSSFNAYTSSTDNRLNNLETTTASINTSITNINSFTTSANSRLNAIESVSGSWITESETSSFARTDVSNIFTQNNSFLQNVSIAGNLYVSGSEVIVSSSTLIVGDRIIEVNANRVIGDAGIYAFDAIGDQTGSLIWNPNLDYWLAGLSGSETRVITAADTASMLSSYITNAVTGAFATTGSNSFNGTQIITGSVTSSTDIRVNSITIGRGAGNVLTNTVVGNSSLAANTTGIGSTTLGYQNLQFYNISGNSFNTAVGYLAGRLIGSGSFAASATVSNNTIIGGNTGYSLVSGSRNTIVGASAFTTANNVERNTGLGRGVMTVMTGPGSKYNTAIGHNAFFTFVSGSNNLAIFGGSVNGEGVNNGSNNIIVGADSGLAATMEGNTIIGRSIAGIDPTTLTNTVILADGVGNVTLRKDGETSNVNIPTGLTVTGSFTASLQQGYAWVGGTGNITIAVATSSFGTPIDTGSFVTTASFDPFSTSVDSRLDNLEAATSSYITSAQTSSLSVENALTASIARNLIVIARNGGASTLPAGTVVHITSAVGDNPIFTTASYDTEALSSNTFGLLRYSSAAGADVEVVVAGVVTGVDTDPALGYVAGDIVYLSSSGQFTRVQPQAPNQIVALGQVLRAQQNNGSIYVSINNGWELDELHNVQINSPQTGDLLQYESASYGLWKNKSISAAGILSTSSFNAYTSSINSELTNIEIATASLFTSASLALVTASVNLNTITFTKGDSTTFALTVNTGSGGGGGATFPYTGSAEITGSLIVTGSARGNVVALTVASSTASIDFGAANYFTLTLPTSSTTHFTATNIRPGTTATLILTTGTGGTGATASFSPSFLQPQGSSYQPTSGSARRDILSFVSFDTASVYVVSSKNMI